jgi:nitric oxide synthase oxygenase domain/subunit
MLIRQFLKPCPKSYFKRIIKELLLEGREPTLAHEGNEVTLYYNHSCECKRMVARMGWFKTKHFCGQFFLELQEIEQTVRKELGL